MHQYNLVEWFIFFYIYCFLGWIWESCYMSNKEKHLVNRGFMHGPFLPIYGVGATVLVLSTMSFRTNLYFVFLFGLIGATSMELLTGLIMEKMFQMKYWDYSDERWNFRGIICVKSSLFWGLLAVMITRFIHRGIEHAIIDLSPRTLEGIVLAITIWFAVDFTQSFNEAMDLKEILIKITESNKYLKSIQRRMGTIFNILDDDSHTLQDRLEDNDKLWQEKLAMDFVEEKTFKEVPLTRRKKIESTIAKSFVKRKNQLLQISSSINIYLDVISKKIYGKENKQHSDRMMDTSTAKIVNSMESFSENDKELEPKETKFEKIKGELEVYRDRIKEMEFKISFLGGTKLFKRTMGMLRRNPRATSDEFGQALEEFKNLDPNHKDTKEN